MKWLARVLVLMLLAAVASPVVLAYELAQVPPPAGCHEHSQKAPAPVSYECCRAGHRFAAVREAVDLRAAFMPVSRVVEFSAASSGNVVCRTQARPLDLGSPGVAALRI